jgi:ABC-2 type transport system permease protein
VSAPGAARPMGAGAPATPSSWSRMALALAAYEFRLVLRRGEGLLITFVIPAGVLLVFSAFDPAGATAEGPAVDRVLPGAIALAVIAASLVSLAISTGFERAYGVIKRLGGSPAGTSVVIAAKTASVLLVEVVQLVLLIGIAVGLLGFRAGPTASVPVLLVALLLGTVAFAGLGLLMAGTLRAEATLALANLLLLLCLVLGGIVLPLDRLPDPVAAVAGILPPAALTEALAIGLGTQAGDPTGPLLLLAVWAAVLASLAARLFRWD